MLLKFGGSNGFELEVSFRLRFVFLRVGAKGLYWSPDEGLQVDGARAAA